MPVVFLLAMGAATPEPMPIDIGVYVVRLDNIDLRAGTVAVTYYVWTRWKGDKDGAAFELVNGTVESKEHEYKAEENGEKYIYWRCRATVELSVDFRKFPLEEHALTLAFEHPAEPIENVVFRVDQGGIKHLKSPEVSGWVVVPPRYEVTKTEYHTNWGYPGADPDTATVYSRFNVHVGLRHAPLPTALKTFLPMIISLLIALLGFLIEPGELEARVGLGVAGTFGVVTNQAVVSGNLPDVSYMTLSDQIHMVGLGCVFLSLLISCLTGYLQKTDRTAAALRIDRIAAVSLVALVGISAAVLIALR